MKKAFDQTVRDLKREVNKKVLKVPGIEQKILDATSNEPWGPHGSLLADIAHASRNHHEYQIIMHVIWKRLNDIGRNWRHVYKALTVLEYLVGHGTERVIDDIREHAYQISTLSDFQYIDSSGRDQGNNVRRKSQGLVALVNDKEKLKEVREKAMMNKDKYRSTFSTSGRGGGSHGGRYDDDRYEGQYRDSYEGRYKDDDRNTYGKERDWGSKDEERYGRGSSPYSRDSDDQYGRDGYRDDDYRGSRGNDDSFGPRNRSFDRDRDRFSEEDDRYSSRNSVGRLDEPSQDERRFEHKLSEQSPAPSYEETVKNAHEQAWNGSNGDPAPSTKTYSPPVDKSRSPTGTSQYNSQPATAIHNSAPNKDKENNRFDEFDPRGSVPAAPAPVPAHTSGPGVDLFSNQSAFDPLNSWALVPVSFDGTSEAEAAATSGARTNFVPLSSASTAFNQPPVDPFGDAPFRATTTQDTSSQQNFTPANPQPSAAPAPVVQPTPTFDFGDTLGGLTYSPNTMGDGNIDYQQHFTPQPQQSFQQPPQQQSFQQQPQQQSFQQPQQQSFQQQPQQQSFQQPQPQPFQQQQQQTFQQPQQSFQQPQQSFQQPQQQTFQQPQQPQQQTFQQPQQSFQQPPQQQSFQQPPQQQSFQQPPQQTFQQPQQQTFQQPQQHFPQPLQQHGYQGNMYTSPNVNTSIVPHGMPQPTKGKFETKSTVWADTLNRGLVDLNISGARVNPLIGDIGVDFEAMNRMEKRKEKNSAAAAAPMVSSTSMGKAMGSGSGMGRAGASSPGPMMRPGMNMGMGFNQPMGMGMNQPMGMGQQMGMMNQQAPMRPPPGPGYGGGYR